MKAEPLLPPLPLVCTVRDGKKRARGPGGRFRLRRLLSSSIPRQETERRDDTRERDRARGGALSARRAAPGRPCRAPALGVGAVSP